MSFTRRVPASETELEAIFAELRRGWRHVKSMRVALNRLECDFDWAANRKVPDFYIPLRREKQKEAHDLVTRLRNEIDSGFPSGRTEISALYGCIDPSG